MTTFFVGQNVRWGKCPSSISMFAETRIKAISGDFAELNFIRGQVSLADLEAITPGSIEAKFWANYQDECEDF